MGKVHDTRLGRVAVVPGMVHSAALETTRSLVQDVGDIATALSE